MPVDEGGLTRYKKAHMPDLVFQSAVEGLFVHGVGKRSTERLKDRLRKIGLNLDRKFDPAYPRDTWEQVLEITREELFPEMEIDTGYFKIGEAIVDGYSETLIGKALVGVVRLLGPKRTLARMTKNLRSANNYNETAQSDLSENGAEIWINEGKMNPYYFAGIFAATVRFAGAKGVQVTVRKHDETGATYEVVWA